MPEFCYDYAYKQQGRFFTEENDGSNMPKITGDALSSEDIQMSIYIRSLVNEVPVVNMYADILDINTSQVSYVRGTTKLAKVGDLAPKPISDASLDVSSIGSNPDYIKNITMGDVTTDDHFYIYYSLEPQASSIDTPINVTIRYSLEVNGELLPYTTRIGEDQMPLCSAGNFTYAPAKGIFNVVHNDYYNSTTQYYNLPTQVTKREGNFKVISLHPTNTDTLNPVQTMVSVEMIDASAFHDTNASCMEIDSAISPKVWVTLIDLSAADLKTTQTKFDKAAIIDAINTNRAPGLASSSDFYAMARENAAFRVSYNLTNDGNDDLVKIEPGSEAGKYKINFTELVQGLGTCAKDMDGIANNVDTVATWCSNNSDKLTIEDIAICMECVYGYNTKFVCSRDNFAIRPEAFKLKLDDQNQTNPASQTVLNAESGTASPAGTTTNIAAGYQYNLEVAATNFLDNTPSTGYTKSISTIGADTSAYVWEPRTGVTLGACNDDVNKTTSMSFVDGVVDTNTSVDQVGDYRLTITDTTWTRVDHDPLFMTHHTGSYFLNANTPDCVVGSSVTRAVNERSDM